jgi:hypothetical protein
MMMNKKAQQGDGSWKVWLFVIAFLLAAVAIYFLGHLAIVLGVIGIVIAIILLISASNGAGDDIGYFGLLVLVISLVLLFGGWAITSFFDNNEVGKLWLGGGKTVINTTAETYKMTKGGLG